MGAHSFVASPAQCHPKRRRERFSVAVLHAHYLAEDLLAKGPRADCTSERHREAVLGHSHLILTLFHRSVDAKYYVGIVVDSVGVVMGREGAVCFNGEGLRGGGGGGEGRRLRSGSGGILLGGLVGRGFTLGGMVASLLLSSSAAATAMSSAVALSASAAASVSWSMPSSSSATSSSKEKDGGGGRRQQVSGCK